MKFIEKDVKKLLTSFFINDILNLIFDSLEKEKSPNPFIHQGLRDFLIVQKVRNFLFFVCSKIFLYFL